MKKKIQCYLRMRRHVRYLKREIHLFGSKLYRKTVDLHRYQEKYPDDYEHINNELLHIKLLRNLHNARLRRYQLLTMYRSAS